MKIRTFNNKVITLEGTVIGSGSEFSGIVSGSIIISVTEITSTVQFPITPEEFELLNNDVSVRLSMAPKTMKKRSIKTRLEKNYINYIWKPKQKTKTSKVNESRQLFSRPLSFFVQFGEQGAEEGLDVVVYLAGAGADAALVVGGVVGLHYRGADGVADVWIHRVHPWPDVAEKLLLDDWKSEIAISDGFLRMLLVVCG